MKKKYRNVIHEGKVPLYGIYIYYSKDSDALIEMYDAEPPNNFNGFCCYNHEKGHIGIHVPHDNGAVAYPTLSHEIFHAAMQVGDFVGLEPTLNANEEIAYIITWITGWVLECIDKDIKIEEKPNGI